MAEITVPEVTISDLPASFGEAPILLDVREQDEWDRGHAADAKHVPMADVLTALQSSANEVPGIPKDADLYVVCHLGGRSMKVAQALLANGYRPRNVTGGMASWAAAGRQVLDKNGAAGSV